MNTVHTAADIQANITDTIRHRADTEVRTYVLDTSVLLSDPTALTKFAEHSIVLPIVVITELEKKRHDLELGFFARRALRTLDDLRAEHGRLDFPVAIGDAPGTLRIELVHGDETVLPQGMRLQDNDSKILAVALALAADGQEVTVVSQDLPMRVKASALGLHAEEYRHKRASSDEYTGVAELSVSEEAMNDLWSDGSLPATQESEALLAGTGVIVQSPRGSALGRVQGDRSLTLVRGDREVFGVTGRSAEQRLAIDLLLDDSKGIVSLGGRAGTGKSALALAAGLEAVLERQDQRKILVFRPIYAVGGQELGYLPGDHDDKMGPWSQAVYDTLGSIVSPNVREEIAERNLIEVLPLTHIRGRSLHDAFVIVDEAQSLELGVLTTMLTRIGQQSKVVLTHDIAQRDNLMVGRHDSISVVIERLKGHSLFGHVTLQRSERSAIAALVNERLEF